MTRRGARASSVSGPPRRLRAWAKRSLGQNFLVDPNLQRKIVSAVEAGEGDPVLEIGAGRGALTEHLATRRVALTAIELDDVLAPGLAARFRGNPMVKVIHGDVLSLDLEGLTGDWGRTTVLGNIPYNITTPILFRLLRPPYPRDIVLTVQSEVARRILADAGSRTYGALSVGVAIHALPERICGVPPTAFRPVPRVHSTLLRITPHAPPKLTVEETGRVRRLVRSAFSWRRKQLGTILARHPELGRRRGAVARALAVTGLDPTLRPEQLTPDDFAALAAALVEE